jgi:diketogulonate reductase-like aldo/keto reductase
LSENPSKRLRISSSVIEVASVIDLTANSLKRIPLMGFGTFAVTSPEVIYNALSVGYRHLDLAENYNNLQHVKQALSLALAPLTEGGLGIGRQDIWITMKIPVTSINNISALLAEVGTHYFDLLLYHYPFSMFDSKAQLKESWIYMTLLKQSQAVKRIGVSNFYASHLTKLFDVCQEFNLEKPFANEIQINPYVYCLEKDTLDLCLQNSIQLIAYSPLGFNAAWLVLQDNGMLSIAKEIGITTAQLSLAWLLSKSICVIPKTNNIQRQEENFRSKDAIYSVLHFSVDMDKISEGKDPRAFLLDTAEKSHEDAERLVNLEW